MKSFSKLRRHYTFATCCFNNFNVSGGFEYFSTFFQRVMQITKTNPSRYNYNCILLRENLLLQQSVHRPHFDLQVLWLRPLENLLCNGQPATFSKNCCNITVIAQVDINKLFVSFSLALVCFILWHNPVTENPLKSSLWFKRFLIKLSKHCGYLPSRFQ